MKKDPLRERSELARLLRGFPRSAQQTNSLFTSDTEILKLGPRDFLVTSTDAISDEITAGLYEDPFTWGWMCVMSSVSDLAASGADALGLLLSTQWGFETSEKIKLEFFRGAKAALKKSAVPLLGGDSGSTSDPVFASTILGRSKIAPLTRMPVRAGDVLAIVGAGQTGLGPCLAYRILLDLPAHGLTEACFRPAPQPARVKKIRPLLSAAIDTSDGIACILAILATLNNVGFDLVWNEKLIHPLARNFCEKNALPPEMIWMGDHGDFQTLLVIPEANASRVLKAKDILPIGRVTTRRHGIRLRRNYTGSSSGSSSGSLFGARGTTQIELPVFEMAACPRDLQALKILVKDLRHYFQGKRRA
jgi:thiamine monophosphate kinase